MSLFSRILLASLICTLVLSACRRRSLDYSAMPDAEQVVDGGIQVQGSGGEAGKLVPYLGSDSASSDITDLVFNGLVRFGPDLQLEGDLAQSWQFKDAGKTIIFKLKPNVKWHDGKPFTSADVAFTVRSIMDPKVASPRKSYFDLLSSLETPDPLTVIARYKKAFAPALQYWGIGIAPKHLLEGKDVNTDPFNRAPVGTGPYVFKVWKDKQYIELEANSNYFEGKVHIAKVRIRFIPEAATQFLEMKTGGIDFSRLQPDQYLHQATGPAFDKIARRIRLQGMFRYGYMAFNLARKPFDDKRVRWALSYAIDRDEIIQGVWEGLARPCTGPYSPLSPFADPAVKAVPLDLTMSAKLLDEAGWHLGKDGIRSKDGKQLKFSLITNQGNPAREKTILILQQQFKKIGVVAEAQTIEWSSFLSNYVNKRNFDAVVMEWRLTPDPDQFEIWHSSEIKNNPQMNFISYGNPKVDTLLEKGRLEFDRKKQIAIYREFHKRVAEDQPMAFLYAPDELTALSLKFRGLLETPTGYTWYAPIRWYIPKSAQQAL